MRKRRRTERTKVYFTYWLFSLHFYIFSACLIFQNFAKISNIGMKGIRLFLSVLLIPLVFQAAFADEEIDTSRAATRRGTTTTVSSNRQKSDTTSAPQKKQSTVSRTTDIDKTKTSVRERSTTKQVSARTDNNTAVIDRNANTKKSATKSLSARTATNVQTRTTSANNTKRVTNRTVTQPSTKSSVKSARVATNTAKRTKNATISRNATDTPTVTAEQFQSRNFSACKNVFFECMDEFCANKDSTLKRCACSARIHDFDRTQKSLEQVEDKLLDFSERLLTVNLDQEDALAMNTATEGELAKTKDKTKSNQILDSIAKKLNTSFDDNNFNQGLNAISLSLNADAAFDNIDSMLGASTTSKSGTALYAAALPVCREMAMEVCSESDQKIAEESYQLAITQDCNLVQKSYEAQTEQARNKVFESGALLDMSRLDIYQKRNSDDILTCKRKMINMLTDTTVCGDKMSKCLDTTGKYIDPSTGEAVLTTDLYEITNLIKRPTGDDTWRSIPENEEFVKYLNTKKIYLEPAMEKCQNISDYVWESFMEDALAQIKLAQEAKINELRQSCTTLTAQCLADSAKSITDFDARALSIFGVKADYTANQMCADIKSACTALINTQSATDPSDPDAPTTPSEWDTGMTDIATEKTYETILATCREVGKNCIIQACSAISGNFGLCENIGTSINRKSIINRRSCWDEVEQCVADAGADAINRIMTLKGRLGIDSDGDGTILEDYSNSGHLYDELYANSTYNSIYDWKGGDYPIGNKDITGAQIYRLTEQIWGNCETAPGATPADENDGVTNKIIVNYDTSNKDNPNNAHETLLSWFARNTKTDEAWDSCRDTTCPENSKSYDGQCLSTSEFAVSGEYCPAKDRFNVFKNDNSLTNCCPNDHLISYEVDSSKKTTSGVCCKEGIATKVQKDDNYAATTGIKAEDTNTAVCTPAAIKQQAELAFSTTDFDYFCTNGTLTYTSGEITCANGYFVAVSRLDKTKGLHYTPVARKSSSFNPFGPYDYVENNFYYAKNAIVYENGTDPSMPDITKYIFKPVAEINPAGTDILTNTDWYSATGTAFCPPTPNINTCCGIKASTTNTTQPDIWNVTFPLQGQK